MANEAGESLKPQGLSMEVPAGSRNKDDIQTSKRRCLVVMLIAAALLGFLEGILSEDSGLLLFFEIAFNLIFLCAVMAWCYIDAEQWGYTISIRLSLMLFILLVFAFPYYIFMTRRGAACLKALGWAVLFILLCYCMIIVTGTIGSVIYNVIYGIV